MFDVHTTVHGSFGSSLADHVYRIDALAGQRLLLSFEWAPTGQAYSYVLISAGDAYGASYGDEIVQAVLQPTTDGPIRLELSPHTYGWTPASDYRLSVVTLPLDDHPAGGTGLASLSVGQSLQADFDIGGDIDSFSVALDKGTTYVVTLVGTGDAPLDSASNASLQLTDSNGYYLGSGYGSMQVQPSESGVFRLSASSADTGRYTLRIETAPDTDADDDYGNAPAEATPLAIGESVDGRIDGSADDDVFAVTMNAGDRLLVSTLATDYSAPGIIVTDAKGLRLAEGSGVGYQTTGALIESAGTQTVFVQVSGQTGTVYEIAATLLPPDDHADVAAAATLLQPDRTTSGRIDGSGDLDLFALDLRAGQQVGLAAEFEPLNTDSTGYGTLGVSGPDGEEVEFVLGDRYGDSLQAAFVAPEDGRYVLALGNNTLVDYELTTTVQGADDHGGDIASATTLALSTPVGGRIGSRLDVDSFTFEARADQKYAVLLSGLDNASWDFLSLATNDGHGAGEQLIGPTGGPLGNQLCMLTAYDDGPLTLQLFGSAAAESGYSLMVVPLAGSAGPVIATPIDMGTLAVGTGAAGLCLVGSAGSDRLVGSAGDDVLRGGLGNDTLVPGLGSDRVDGGAGTDTLIVAGPRSAYRLETFDHGDGDVASWLSSLDGGSADRLDGIERLRFDDGWTALEFDPGLGTVVALLAALFGADAVHTEPEMLLEGIRLADGGLDATGLAAAALASDRFAGTGIGDSNAALIAALDRNAPSLFDHTGEMSTWQSALDSGAIARPQALALLVADLGGQDLVTLVGSPLELWIPAGP